MQHIPDDSCTRCGTCCLKGGPILHHEDKELLLAGPVGHQHLVTIRKGEMVFDPELDTLRPADQELIKVRGKGENWCCCLYDKNSVSCTIYEHRFLECRLLKCWDPSGLITVIGRNTIVRTDIINSGDPIIDIIKIHEQECSYQEVQVLLADLARGADKPKTLAELTRIARKDLAIRSYATSELGLRQEYALFIFGRSLTEILRSHGISVRSSSGG
jgi:Fe-S-cluster containining protein